MEPASEASREEISGQNTSESELLNLSAEKTNNTSDLAVAAETQEGRETSTVLTIIKRRNVGKDIGYPVGEGCSFYLTDGDWDNFEPDAWQAEKNNQVRFDVGHYEGLNKSQVEEILTEQGYVVENGELWTQDMMWERIRRKAIMPE